MVTRYTGPLYHWSPRGRKKSILKNGLQPSQPSRHGALLNEDGSEWYAPWLCFGISPSEAWSWYGYVEPDTYDLWEVERDPSDKVRHRRDGGTEIIEVRIHNAVGPSRLRWIGERTQINKKKVR